MTPILEAKNLTKRIGRRMIIRDVSFEVRPGEVMGFLGPNGAGKTTTIRMLTGLIRPTSGSITIGGHDLDSEFEEAISNLGCIVETPDLYKFMTGRENLRHFARMVRNDNPAEIARAAEITRIETRLDEKVETYSLGMRQRLGIAIALLGSPRLLILDEPANGLDPVGIREIRSLVRHLAEDEDVSVFISSHLLSEIELMCDRVAIINRGELIQSGPVAHLIEPKRRFVIETRESERAAELLNARQLDPELFPDGVSVTADTSEQSEIIRTLVESGVTIVSARSVAPTLEELFLETTSGETVQ